MALALVTKNYSKTKYFIDAAIRLGDSITYDMNSDYDYILPHPYVSYDVINNISLYDNSDSLYTCLDKNRFYEFCAANGFLYPSYTTEFPCVVKPIVGESSEGVIIATTPSDIPDIPCITQRYVVGKLIGLNIAIDNQEIIIYNKWIVDSNLPNDFKLVNVRQTTSSSKLGHEVISEVDRMIRLLNFNNQVIQLELFVTDDEQHVISFVELNPRTGSKGVESLYSVCGYCPVLETVKLHSGRKSDFKSYVSQNGSLTVCLNTIKSQHVSGDIIFKDNIDDNYIIDIFSADDLYKKYGFVHTKHASYDESISSTERLLKHIDRV